jgi:hypothetical protein
MRVSRLENINNISGLECGKIVFEEAACSESVKNPYWTTEPSINCYIMPKNSLYSMFLAHF